MVLFFMHNYHLLIHCLNIYIDRIWTSTTTGSDCILKTEILSGTMVTRPHMETCTLTLSTTGVSFTRRVDSEWKIAMLIITLRARETQVGPCCFQIVPSD